MTVAITPVLQYFDNAGNPLSGGKVFTYAAGTLTKIPSYTDRGGLTNNANPVILDSAGRADIWLSTNVPYKIVVTDSTEANVFESTDNYYAGADPSQLVLAGIVPATGGTYTGLVSFTGGATFNGTAAQNLATLDSLGIAAVQNADLWINSDFAINQRVSVTAADGAYGFDRTVNLCETGSVTLSQLAQPTDGIPYALRQLQPDATPKRMGSLQIAEAKDCLAYRGKNLVFAPKFRSSAATTIRVALVAWTGTLDAPTRDVVNNWASTNYTAGNFFVANTLTIAVGAVALSAGAWTDVPVSSVSPGGVVVPSTLNNLYMVYWTDAAVAQNVTLDASIMRCGQGTAVPIWTPPDAEVELGRCMRYFRTTYQGQAAGTVNASNGRIVVLASSTVAYAAFFLNFAPVMRATPTLIVYNPSTGVTSSIRNESSGTDFGSGAIGTPSISPNYAGVQTTAAPPASATMSLHYTADAEL